MKSINNLLDNTIGKVPAVGNAAVKSLTPKTQGGGCNSCANTEKSGGYKYSKRASLARSRRMTKRRKARSLKSKRGKRRTKTRGRRSRGGKRRRR